MRDETKVTIKSTTIREEQRRRARISAGTVLRWELPDKGVVARARTDAPSALQRHIRTRAGAWNGEIPGVELLKRTRP